MSLLFDDASTQYLERTPTPVRTGTPITISGWVFRDDNNINADVCSIGQVSVSDNFFELFVADDANGNAVRAATNGSSFQSANSTLGTTANTWHHVAGVWQAGTAVRAAFLDGGNKGTDENPAGTPTGLDRTRIGRRANSSGSNPASGRIAEVAVWSEALTDNEIAMLAAGVPPIRVRPQKLRAYWPIYGVASPEPNYGRIGVFNMTLVNGPVQANHAPVAPTWGYDISPTDVGVAIAALGVDGFVKDFIVDNLTCVGVVVTPATVTVGGTS